VPAPDDNITIYSGDAVESSFSVPRLAFSLTQSLSGDDTPAETAFWLAQSVYEATLSANMTQVSSFELATLTHDVLGRYDKRAALHYAMRYRL